MNRPENRRVKAAYQRNNGAAMSYYTAQHLCRFGPFALRQVERVRGPINFNRAYEG